MKTESIEEFMARGGKVQKSENDVSLEELLYNEGLMDHNDAQKVQKTLSENINSSLDKEFKDTSK
jgi:hypothetical protein